MIFRQVVTHIRHIAQLTLLLCDIAMYGLLAYEFGFYQSAISHLSPEVALATIGVAFLINVLLLQQQDFYANYYCLQPTVLFKRSMTSLCIVLFILLILLLLIQHPLQSINTLYGVLGLTGYLIISRLVIYFLMKPAKQEILYTHDVQFDVGDMLQSTHPYLIGVVNPQFSVYAHKAPMLVTFSNEYLDVLDLYMIDELLIDDRYIDAMRPGLMEEVLDKHIIVNAVNVITGDVRPLSFAQMFAPVFAERAHGEPMTNKQVSSESVIRGFVMGGSVNQNKPAAIGVIIESINPTTISVLNEQFDMRWYCTPKVPETVKSQLGKILPLEGLSSCNCSSDTPLFIINEHYGPIQSVYLANALHNVYSLMRLLPLESLSKVCIMSTYPWMNKSLHGVTSWIEEGIRGYCLSFANVQITTMRMGNDISHLQDFTDAVHDTLGSSNTLTLSHPTNPLWYYSKQQLMMALDDWGNIRSSVPVMDFYVEVDASVLAIKIVEKVILSQGKYPRIHDGKVNLDTEVKILFDTDHCIDPLGTSPYWANNVSGTHYRALIGFETKHINRKTYSYLADKVLGLLQTDDVSAALALMLAKGDSALGGAEDGSLNGSIDASLDCSLDGSDGKSETTDNNVVSVGFRDVFGPRPS